MSIGCLLSVVCCLVGNVALLLLWSVARFCYACCCRCWSAVPVAAVAVVALAVVVVIIVALVIVVLMITVDGVTHCAHHDT